jgi:hypothetical protein
VGRITIAIYVSNIPLDTTQEMGSTSESSCLCLFLPLFSTKSLVSERTLRRSRLRYACTPCGVHLQVGRGNSLYVFSAYPHFLALRFTLCPFRGEKCSVPCSVFLQSGRWITRAPRTALMLDGGARSSGETLHVGLGLSRSPMVHPRM